MSNIVLRHYQAEVTPAVTKYFRDKPGGHALVAIPTGAGKTYAIADLIRHCVEKWGETVVILSHVKEILEQNHKSLEKYLERKVYLNSAMLGRREVGDITVAGIQSVYKNPYLFADCSLVIIDEAHLISTSEDTMYQKFFAGLGKHVCVGFTATPYRLGSGLIYGKHAMFDDLVLDWTTADKYTRLVDEGYLAKLTTKRTRLEMDTSDIKLIGGDFSERELAKKFDVEAVTNEAIVEILAAGKERKKWLVFAIDIKHAEHIAKTLNNNNISTALVHSKMTEDRATVIEDFKDGKYKCMVNVNILTTGFDVPSIDLIAMLRPTQSPVLHVQAFGRGCRIDEDKTDCLILDFAGNTSRLGPINDVQVTKRKRMKDGEGGDPITKDCPKCWSIVHAAVRKCPDCGYKFPIRHKLESQASTRDVVADGKPHWVNVDNVDYEINRKLGAPSSVKVTYVCNDLYVNEWVCVEHKGFAKHKADHWVKFRGGVNCNTVEDFITQTHCLKTPRKILVHKKDKYNLVKDAVFD